MAKRARKHKQTEAELAEIEADRIAAFEDNTDQPTPPAELEVIFTPDPVAEEEARHEDYEDFESAMEGDAAPMEGEAELDPERNSVVKGKFKQRYAENAALIGDKRKQVKRSNWDWLAQMLAAFCLNDKGGKIDIGAFIDILDANGVDHSNWGGSPLSDKPKTKGWEGRFRMTGRVALQKIVANAGMLKWPGDQEPSAAPAEWCGRYKTKES
jgi:hypothetical protein